MFPDDQANIAWFTSKRETIENECIPFEIYLDAKERVNFSLYYEGYSITKCRDATQL